MNVFHTYGKVSSGLFIRVRRYGLLYLWTVEYDQYNSLGLSYDIFFQMVQVISNWCNVSVCLGTIGANEVLDICRISFTEPPLEPTISWLEAVVGFKTLQTHPSDSDAGWNPTQHSTWPRALSEEFEPAVNNWWEGLRRSGVCKYCRKSINKCATEPQPLKWTNKWVSVGGMTAWWWVEIISTQHLLTIFTQHPDEKYGSDISLLGVYHDFISYLL